MPMTGDSTTPDSPVMTIYSGSVFAGTETKDGLLVYVFNADKNGAPVSKMPGIVQYGLWSVIVDFPPADGDRLYAEAREIVDGQPGPWSAPSQFYSAGHSPYLTTPNPPHLTTCSAVYFSGTEETLHTSIMVMNATKSDTPAARIPAYPYGGSWMLWADVPLDVGDEFYAVATQHAAPGIPPGTKTASPTQTVTSADFRPVPPSITVVPYPPSTIISGVLFEPGAFVTLTIQPPGEPPQSFPPVLETDGNWSVDVGAEQPLGTLYSATASFSKGQASDVFTLEANAPIPMPVYILSVGSNSATAVFDPSGPHILGWRSSDGKKIVDHIIPIVGNDLQEFTIPYMDGMTLGVGDLLNLSAASIERGTMSQTVRQAQGYQAPGQPDILE